MRPQQRASRERQRQRAAGWLRGAGAFPVAWTMQRASRGNTFMVFTGVVVNGEFQPRDETFNITDSCEFAPGT